MGSEEKYYDVTENDNHCFCHSCHTHFTVPKQDAEGIMVCPACKSNQIELNS